jgi:hypothetical protein
MLKDVLDRADLVDHNYRTSTATVKYCTVLCLVVPGVPFLSHSTQLQQRLESASGK